MIEKRKIGKRLNFRRQIVVLERSRLPGLSDIFRKTKKTEKEEEQMKEAVSSKTYLKAMPLRGLSDLEIVKNEVKSGNIVILRVRPLADENPEDVKEAVNELCAFVESVGGDIARLGEERVVICPQNVKIWREKTSIQKEAMPTAA